MNIIPDPMNRPDGRHWCNPASAEGGSEGSEAECPNCGRVWVFDGVNVWSPKAEE